MIFPIQETSRQNASTPKELCKVKYKDLDHAIDCCFPWAEEINGIKKIFYSKSDVQSAFLFGSTKKKVLEMASFQGN